MKKLLLFNFLLLGIAITCIVTCTQKGEDVYSEFQTVPEVDSQPADSATIAECKKELQDLKRTDFARAAMPSAIAAGNYPSDVEHIFVIQSFENQDAIKVRQQADYMMSLANQGTYYDNFSSRGHPSQPNYYRNFCGTSIVSDNNDPGARSQNKLNLATQLISKGKTFGHYAEDLPSIGWTGWSSGRYRGRHNAVRGFNNIPASVSKPFSMLDLNNCETIVFIQPNEDNNGHDTNIPTSDDWIEKNPKMKELVAKVMNPANKSQLWITYDEGSPGNIIFVCGIGYKIKKGLKVTTALDQYDMLNMWCDIYGAPRINTAATKPANQFMNQWVDGTVVNPPTPTDTTKCYKTETRTKTVTYDTTFVVPCVGVPPVTTDSIWRGVYLNSVGSYLNDPAKRQAVINDCKKAGFKYTFAYGINGALNSSLAGFNEQLRNAGLIPGATFSSTNGVNNLVNFNVSNPDAKDFDLWNSESEPWITNPIVTWSEDENLIRYMNSKNEQAGVDVTNYRGWPNANNFIVLVDNSTFGLYHDYQKVPSFSYLKSRIDNTNTVARNKGIIYRWRVIFSLESAFMQSWIKAGHTLDEAYRIIYNSWRAQNYSNNILDGYLCFTLDHWRACQPIPEGARMRNIYSDPEFDPTYTDPKHIETAKER